MSRIGKKAVAVPAGVTVTIEGQTVTVKGPKGQLSWTVAEEIEVTQEGGELTLSKRQDTTRAQAMWGLSRTLVANMVQGVTEGFERTLELVGVGYRAALKGTALSMQLGFSHDVDIKAPDGNQDLGHRQAGRRRNRRSDPPHSSAGALQGQGRPLSRRDGASQGRQEEVGHGSFSA